MSNPEMIRHWQRENPELTERMRNCGPQIQRVNQAILERTMDELEGLDNEFEMLEFVDRVGQRLNGFNVINQMISQLGGNYEVREPVDLYRQAKGRNPCAEIEERGTSEDDPPIGDS